MPAFLNTRGCSPHGIVRETRTPAGRTVGARFCQGPKRDNAIRTPGGIAITGYFPVLLVTIRRYRPSRSMKAFRNFCKWHGLQVKVPHVVADKGAENVFEVSGPGPALEDLSVAPFVVKWEMPIDAKPPRDMSKLGDSSNQKPIPPRVVKFCDRSAFVVGPDKSSRVRSVVCGPEEAKYVS